MPKPTVYVIVFSPTSRILNGTESHRNSECRVRIGQPEFDRLSSGIDGAIQVSPVAREHYASFVNTPVLIGSAHLAPNPLAQNRSIALNPAPDSAMISLSRDK